MSFILSDYSVKFNDNIRKDYTTRTIILIMQKYNIMMNLNINIFNEELEKTVTMKVKTPP